MSSKEAEIVKVEDAASFYYSNVFQTMYFKITLGCGILRHVSLWRAKAEITSKFSFLCVVL